MSISSFYPASPRITLLDCGNRMVHQHNIVGVQPSGNWFKDTSRNWTQICSNLLSVIVLYPLHLAYFGVFAWCPALPPYRHSAFISDI
ncbi:hypothetical protein K469DRAFT_188088 [Zopfia rhizophila CBS 207.26]|uniref:Uncharacterized protein n=1 Tax=Zopfia rhizophila CBS 207.26 TaxID=1314779 RepID=A0A6A6EQU6_9PEZI|nr:hypothetical protein K469DRAFT_188088 [Zopfia rhizophila CBS 207.26]